MSVSRFCGMLRRQTGRSACKIEKAEILISAPRDTLFWVSLMLPFLSYRYRKFYRFIHSLKSRFTPWVSASLRPA